MNKYTYMDTRNCRKYFRRIYTLENPVSEELLAPLSQFGELRINDFSKIVPGGRKMFTVTDKDKDLTIQGSIGANDIYVVIPKKEETILNRFENILKNL